MGSELQRIHIYIRRRVHYIIWRSWTFSWRQWSDRAILHLRAVWVCSMCVRNSEIYIWWCLSFPLLQSKLSQILWLKKQEFIYHSEAWIDSSVPCDVSWRYQINCIQPIVDCSLFCISPTSLLCFSLKGFSMWPLSPEE